MDDTPEGERSLRLLRRLVTVLTATMIAGLLTIVVLIVIRFSADTGSAPVLPESLTLPQGARVHAITQGPGWFAVVTEDERILIYDAATGALRQEVEILR